MTREQKLALIIGFSFVLLVGVLISDHLSSARKAKINKVEPEQQPIAAAPISPPGPAPQGGEVAISPTSDPALQLIVGSSTPAPAATPTPATLNPLPESTAPTTIAAALTPPPAATQPDPQETSTIREQLASAGAKLVKNDKGDWDIHLPTAPPIRGNSLATPAPKVSPIADTRIEPLKTHTVKSGESLFQITARYYGDGNLWTHLAKFNNMDKRGGGTIRIGASLKIPSKNLLLGGGRAVANQPVETNIKTLKPAPSEFKPIPRADRPRITLASYTVRKGDTLGEISKKTLGTSRRWQEIAELNNLDDEDAISTGTVLKIPAKRS